MILHCETPSSFVSSGRSSRVWTGGHKIPKRLLQTHTKYWRRNIWEIWICKVWGEYTTEDMTNLGKNQQMKWSWRKSDLAKGHEQNARSRDFGTSAVELKLQIK